jgi:hypothetical protein
VSSNLAGDATNLVARLCARKAESVTRPEQKDSERRTVDALLQMIGVVADREPDHGEAPDFTAHIRGRVIGIEVTTYHSDTLLDDGMERRKVESEWEALKRVADACRRTHTDVRDVNVGLMFKGIVPSRREHSAFIEEVVGFIRARASELRREPISYWGRTLTSPLMSRYLRTLQLCVSNFAEWYSNVAVGWVGLPDSTLASIITAKSAMAFRPTDDLWLAIQCSHRISEIVLPLNGPGDFENVPELTAALLASPFSRVFVLTPAGDFEWDRAYGWHDLSGEQLARGQGRHLMNSSAC